MRRPSTISLVMPSSVNRKWRVGSSKGELMIGFSMTTCFTDYSLEAKAVQHVAANDDLTGRVGQWKVDLAGNETADDSENRAST